MFSSMLTKIYVNHISEAQLLRMFSDGFVEQYSKFHPTLS